ncbi:autophagy associated lipase [Dipodascopsis tothii]|uniref:autophagy associated lipase n=1 Tax=Dipodascopsis tothii TaxID=44089 RepID=UPI0034CF25EE
MRAAVWTGVMAAVGGAAAAAGAGMAPFALADTRPAPVQGVHELRLRHALHSVCDADETVLQRDVHAGSERGDGAGAAGDGRPPALQVLSSYYEAVLLDGTAGAAGDTFTMSVPCVEDKETVMSLAKMSANAYLEDSNSTKWRDVGPGWNKSSDYGWDSDGVRGYVFASDNNATIVITIKGTSTILSGEDSELIENDRENDNLLFSCCCAHGDSLWRQVCDCNTKAYTCNQTCLTGALRDDTRYYRAASLIYETTVDMYPGSAVWLAGHSLGGALSSLVAQTYGRPAVAFEAPGDQLAATRLGLPPPQYPNGSSLIWHFGNNADPIFMGTCNGPLSFCTLGGYAMETQCHSGNECVYDTIEDLQWHLSIVHHEIERVVDMMDSYNETAACATTEMCQDCYLWNFV